MKVILVIFALVSALFVTKAEAAVLEVGVNRAELIVLDVPMSEVMIANPEVADLVIHGQGKISVIGKKIGSTNMRVFDDKNNVIREYDITVGYDLPAIRRSLKKYYPDLSLGVETINNSIAVSGVVPDAQASNRVMQIVYEFVKEAKTEDIQDFKETDNRFPGIVNLMTLNSGQQVMLKVKIGELRRSALKNLGVNLQVLGNTANGLFQIGTGSGQALVNGTSTAVGSFGSSTLGSNTFGKIGGQITRGNYSVGGVLEALQQDGIFKIIAEPNLTAVSGETASFLSGGEFPVVTSTANTGTTVEYKKFGVNLSFTPYVLTKNRIRMTVSPELSEIDTSVAGGANSGIAALSSRKATTTIELAPGEAFMIAGLIRDRINATVNSVPGIAEIPIISALVRSSSYQREESELVIAVTPYIVDPVVSSEIRTPADEFRSPSVMEMFFYGALGSLSGGAQKIGETPILEGPIGFMVD